MAIKRQPATFAGHENGTKGRHRIAPGRNKDEQSMNTTLLKAFARALCVLALIATPTLFLPQPAGGNSAVVALVAIFAAIFTVVEYSSASPSFIEFRSAPPFNRLRFAALFVTVLTLSLIMRGEEAPSTLTMLLQVIGQQVGNAMDVPFSPVRLIQLMMTDDTPAHVMETLRVAAGLAYVVSLLSIATFIVMLRVKRWPRRTDSFNVWINLPMFDPTAGDDVVVRLNRDSQINLILGFLLPFLIPAIGKLITIYATPIALNDPQTLIWMVAAWAFLPSSLLMRGIALSRVAQMIHAQRKRAYAAAAADGLLPV
ncbi:hypothetical protein [Loktanella sp. DSM 29012]|uniref:hypothetical protein n=1 Tax=Loktanella sp. DSM 29012 TaxID=1881056 RepID=UPI00210BFF97|nr:hypothetical protein [Loktanella sp. DSM 29012]